MVRFLRTIALLCSVLFVLAPGKGEPTKAEYHYLAHGEDWNYRGRIVFELGGGILTVSHFGENFRGLDPRTPSESLQPVRHAPSFLINVGDETFLLSETLLTEKAITRFLLGSHVTNASVEAFLTDGSSVSEPDVAQVISGEPGSGDFKLAIENFPKIDIQIYGKDGLIDKLVPVLVPQDKMEQGAKVHDLVVFDYRHESPNVASGSFRFRLDGSRLLVKHTAATGIGFKPSGGIEPAPHSAAFIVQYGDKVVELDPDDFVKRGELTYQLPDGPDQVRIGLNEQIDSPYKMDFYSLRLRNKHLSQVNYLGNKNIESANRGPSSENSKGESKLMKVYAVRALETGSLSEGSQPTRRVQLRYETYTREKHFGLFELRIDGQEIIISHRAKNAFALHEEVTSAATFNPRFIMRINGKVKTLEIPGAHFARGDVRVPLDVIPVGNLDVTVPLGVDSARFQNTFGRLSSSVVSCDDAFKS